MCVLEHHGALLWGLTEGDKPAVVTGMSFTAFQPQPIVERPLPYPLPASVPTWTYGYPSAPPLRPNRALNVVSALVLIYAPKGKQGFGGTMRDAWSGDRLLSFAVSVALMDMTFLSRGECCDVSSEVCSNLFLSRSFDCRWDSVERWRSTHERGSIVEACLYRLWKERGVEPIVQIARALLTESSRLHTRYNRPKALASALTKPDGTIAFIPTKSAVVVVPSVPSIPAGDTMPTWLKLVPIPTASPKPSLPPFLHHIVAPASGAPIGYRSTTGEQVLYGDDYHRRADGPALKSHHWFCAPGQSVKEDCFNPPVSPKDEAVLQVTAFHRDISRAGYTFRRAALGEVWVRA